MTINSSSAVQLDSSHSSDSPFWRPSRPASTMTSSSSTSPPSPAPLETSTATTATTATAATAAAAAAQAAATTTTMKVLDLSTYPNGKRSLSGISLRAFLLGILLGIASCISIVLAFPPANPNPLWRIPFFLASLCLFHFFEFYVTARYNTREASVSAFLLSSNGWAYNVAHGSAMLECLIGYLLFPESSYFSLRIEDVYGIKLSVVLGVLLMALGQTVRTLAMVQAGSNFNHTVQVEYKEGHTLVRNGVYALSRHPSYFGFFWWGLGTQLVLGNMVCFVGYTVVLWRFFSSRIHREEKYLACFFGDDYLDYKKTTWVGIPGIK